MVGAAIVLQALPSGLLQQAFGAYVVLLERDFGWSRTVLSGAFSVVRVEEGLLGPLQGWMIDRFGPRNVMRIGTIVFAAGFFIFANISSVLGFYLAFMVMAIGASLAGFLSITTAIVNWFDRKRSMAMGIALLGTAVGGLLLPVVVVGLEMWGWRTVANLSGAIVLILGLPMVQVMRRRPEDHGMLPDGRDPVEAAAEAASAAARGDVSDEINYTAREALRTRAFWFISLAHAASVLVVSVVTVHFTPHATGNLGYSLSAAAGIVTLQTITNLIGRPLGGWLSDRIGSRAVIIMCMIVHAVALLLLAFANALWMLASFALLNGLAWGARVPVIVSIRAEYFGAKSFGAIMGISSSVVTVAAVIAPVLAAMAYDSLGSYTLSFVILAVMAALGSLFMVFTPPPQARAPRAVEATLTH